MPPPRALRPAAVPDDRHPAGSSAFSLAVAQVEAGIAAARAARPEVTFDSEPPPRRLAPQAFAIAATVDMADAEAGDAEVGDAEVGAGRFVLLYDPAGQEGWAGPFRVIAYLRAELEPEIAADQFIGEVGWSWLIEALDTRLAKYAASSGSVTRVVTEGFGSKSDEPVTTDFEMRASWSPVSDGRDGFALDRHAAAWVEALCLACGMPPAEPGLAPGAAPDVVPDVVAGVAQLPPPQLRSAQLRPRRRQ